MTPENKIPRAGFLSFWIKLAYGTGDYREASYGTLRQFVYAIFLTDVVGLEPRLASFAALIGILCDAVNDPLVGILTNRMRSRWGRRRPFLLFFSIPFGANFLLLWWAPPWHSQLALAAMVTLMLMVRDTFETLCGVPFSSLLPELTPDYMDRSLSRKQGLFPLVDSGSTNAIQGRTRHLLCLYQP